MANLVTYDEYVELFSDWQGRLLDIADKISVTSNLILRIHWRNELARRFKEFIQAVNDIENKITRQKNTMPTLSINQIENTTLTMNDNDENNNNNDNEDDDDDDTVPIETDTESEATYDYDEVGSIDAMFEDLNALREEYNEVENFERPEDPNDEILRLEVLVILEDRFEAVKTYIANRMRWSTSLTERTLGDIRTPRTNTYIQNTGGAFPVTRTNIEATMVGTDDWSWEQLVPVRLFNGDGSFTDYNASGRAL